MTRESAHELIVGAGLLALGMVVELLAPPSWPVAWVHGVAIQGGGMACLLDAVIRPNDPPSRVLIAGLVIGYGLMLSP